MTETIEACKTDLNQLVPPEIFRAYDIRGVYGEQLSEPGIELIGRSIGSEARSLGITTLLVGRDGRLSSPSLCKHLIQGIRSSGCAVVDLGIVPSPLLYFATHTTKWNSGVMLTASHNPASYNGIKMVFKRACLADNQIQRIRQRIVDNKLSNGSGGYETLDLKQDYIDKIRQTVPLSRPVRIVLDCGNGATAVVAQELFEALGCDVTPLYCDLDGRFPNHPPDPTRKENLRGLAAEVLEQQADLGLAFDGDGDRLGVVTNTGKPVDTDSVLAVLIKSILPSYPGEAVVYDVKCSSRLTMLIQKLGGHAVMHRSGHSFMKQEMEATQAPLGGEFSAHIFIRDRWYGYDDGMYTGVRLLEILADSDKSADQLFAVLGPRSATEELSVPVAEAEKFALVEAILARADFPDARLVTIDGLRAEFADGWGLVRASNTSAALLLRFEADNDQALERIQQHFKSLLLDVAPELQLHF